MDLPLISYSYYIKKSCLLRGSVASASSKCWCHLSQFYIVVFLAFSIASPFSRISTYAVSIRLCIICIINWRLRYTLKLITYLSTYRNVSWYKMQLNWLLLFQYYLGCMLPQPFHTTFAYKIVKPPWWYYWQLFAYSYVSSTQKRFTSIIALPETEITPIQSADYRMIYFFRMMFFSLSLEMSW